MNVFHRIFTRSEEVKEPTISDVPVWEEEENYNEREIYAQVHYSPLAVINYDGEKNPGEIGTINDYIINYYRLAKRSWQSFIESEVTQTLVHKYVRWVVGKGLRLRAEPDSTIINRGDFNEKEFSDIVERRWKLWSKSKSVDYKGRDNLAGIEKEAYKTAIVGGDILVVLRIRRGKLTVQLIDGDMVVTPPEKAMDSLRVEGNRVVNGIEINSKGEHVAFYVKKRLDQYDRILARGSRTGRLMAYMVYGRRFRIRDQRGISIYAAILEKLAKLDRYTEATVASAEEAAKIAWYINHL
jgi:capsid protein